MRNSTLPLPASVAVRTCPCALLTIFFFTSLLSLRLGPEWLHNPDLSHGLFMPLIFLFLIRESRKRGPLRWTTPTLLRDWAVVAFLAAVLVFLALAGLYAAALGWSHALVEWLLVASYGAFVFAGILLLSDSRLRIIPLNASAMAAAGLWLLCCPIPDGTAARLNIALQSWLTENVLRTLHVLGIPANRVGNVIELARASVGVEEACNGVRSLFACLFVGIIFAIVLLRGTAARIALVASAVVLALATNFVRSLFLTLLVNQGTNISTGWHDAAGYMALVVTITALAGIAKLCVGSPPSPSPAPPSELDTADRHASRGKFILFNGTAAAALGLLLFFAANTKAVHVAARPPDLLAQLPHQVAGWDERTEVNLQKFSGTLRTKTLVERAYLKNAASGPVYVTLYLAYWAPGEAPVSLVAAHTPDACWPGVGWREVSPHGIPRDRMASARGAEEREYLLGTTVEYVWFWHFFAGRLLPRQNPDSLGALLKLAVKYGFQHDGPQWFVRISSNRPGREIFSEPLLQEFFTRAQPFAP